MPSRWKPRWLYRERKGKLIPYCTLDGGPANRSHLPEDGETLMPCSEGELFRCAFEGMQVAAGGGACTQEQFQAIHDAKVALGGSFVPDRNVPELICKSCGQKPYSTLTDQCPHCGAPEYGSRSEAGQLPPPPSLLAVDQGYGPTDDPAPATPEPEQGDAAPVEQCESCEDTGIYQEGSEWAPCGDCEHGREIAHYLKAATDEIRAERDSRLTKESVREKLLDEAAIAALYGTAPNLVTDNDAGPNDEETQQLREALEEVFDAAFGEDSAHA